MKFSHLHNHTQFSLLDGASNIKSLFKKALANEMPAMAITDHGNMFGAFEFITEAYKHLDAEKNPKVKPIIGCEFYLSEERLRNSFTRDNKDKRYHQLLLAKNEDGYKNLIKLCSLGFTEGLYGKYPRIDKALIKEYHKGLIATTCCLGAMVPQAILKHGEEAGEKEFLWWKEIFSEDYYVELQRHGIGDQTIVNEVLVRFARKHNVAIIASNDSHYLDQEDYETHDTLLCVSTSAKKATEKKLDFGDEEEGSDIKKRFAFNNDQFFFKTPAQMLETFKDLPEAIDNTNEIVGKIENYQLKKKISLPKFPYPDQFKNEMEYLEFLTNEGAKTRYPVLTPEANDRIKFELGVISKMGFEGYFLIVSDFIGWAKGNSVSVGPGRGSAAGSVVAYCIGITNIDPLKYNLLFERFLNPDRASMPDIDTDFDDIGRNSVIDYVVQKYGSNQVAQIITYGTMAAKSSIKDVARVMDLPLDRSNYLAKLVPDKPGTSLRRVLQAPLRGTEDSIAKKDELSEEDLKNIELLREIYNKKNDLESTILHDAEKLEGTVRNVGTHAAGIIIAPTNLSDLIPVCKTKESNLLVTQFEGNIIEDAGVIKMDFLGLKNLTIIKDAVQMIKENHGDEIDIDNIPLDDSTTYKLYQDGFTNGTFQFESPGMQKYLRDLKPDVVEDLIAMCALYRPGPMAYIPDFVNRKHGRQEITYDLPEMEEFLKETYGITVYQEQVMQLSQKLGNFTKGDADTLRKAMGKKQIETLQKMKQKFLDGCEVNGHPETIAQKIWTDWEAFAQYAFNKSHSACYAILSYQTAYLKANYPCEYMSALLNNTGTIERVSFYMDECKRMGIQILGPDVNESGKKFAVSNDNIIRFGLGAIKGVGENAVEDLIKNRNEQGPFTDVFNLVERVPCKSMSKRNLEYLAQAGALDSFEVYHRGQYFFALPGDVSNLDKLSKYATAFQNQGETMANSLFGDIGGIAIARPTFIPCEPWNLMELLNKEKEVIGMYLTGHPLDPFRFELDNYNIIPIPMVKDERNYEKPARIAGFISSVKILYTKKGDEYGRFSITDYSDTLEITMFSKEFIQFKNYFTEGAKIMIMGMFAKRAWAKDDRYEFQVSQIYQLDQVKQVFSKRLNVALKINSITKHLIDQLDSIMKNNQGKMELTFTVTDPNLEKPFALKSYNKVTLTDELMAFIDGLDKNDYRLICN
jgi:DNA polymerase III subunit alpha